MNSNENFPNENNDVDEFLFKMKEIFSSENSHLLSYFGNEREYLKRYRLHSRICGLLAKVGFELGYNVDINRKFSIEPIAKTNRNKKVFNQRQAEADVSFIDKINNEPVILLDYETSDADFQKMRNKFSYLESFKKTNQSIKILCFLITATPTSRNQWKLNETPENRLIFVQEDIQKLIKKLLDIEINQDLTLILGVFSSNVLQISSYRNGLIESNSFTIEFK